MQEFEPLWSVEDERRRLRRWLVLGAIACLLLLAALIPSPYVIERPGPTVDVLGTVETDDGEQPVIRVEGARAYRGEGSLRLLTVSISGTPQHPTSWLSLVPALLDSSQRIRPLEEVFPSGRTEDQRNAANAVLMDDSQTQAAVAAFNALGEDVEMQVLVADVADAGPAAGLLRTGDAIREAGGAQVSDFVDLRERVLESGPGRPLDLLVERDGERLAVSVTPSVPDGGNAPMLGVTVSQKYTLPYDVEYSLDDIGGPSAGLVFALGVVDLMTPGSLIEDVHASGTGTITPRGDVGAIGGVEQKMQAASRSGSTLFLMPIDNCADVPERIPDGLAIAPVATLDEAIAAIEKAAGGGAASLERCVADRAASEAADPSP